MRRGLTQLELAFQSAPEIASHRQTTLNLYADLAKSLVQQEKFADTLDECKQLSAKLSATINGRPQLILASLVFIDSCLRQMDGTEQDATADQID